MANLVEKFLMRKYMDKTSNFITRKALRIQIHQSRTFKAAKKLRKALSSFAFWFCVKLYSLSLDAILLTPRTYTPVEDPVRGITPVLILAYMRSGSSFTGQLFNSNPDSIYFFEPLFSLGVGAKTLKFANGNNTEKPVMETQSTIGSDLLYNIYTCNIGRLFREVMENKPMMHAGIKTRKFQACEHPRGEECLGLLQKLCSDSTLRTIKSIRLRLYDTRRLLDSLPSLKIIHLVRDPRAIIESRRVLFDRSTYHGKTLCEVMAIDLYTAELFNHLYPGRVFRLYYELLADDPIGMAEKVYNFIGKTLPPEVQIWIDGSSKGDSTKDDKPFSKSRTNSSMAAMLWRTKIPWELSQYMDQQCGEVYSNLGFLPFSSEAHLRDLSKPSMQH